MSFGQIEQGDLAEVGESRTAAHSSSDSNTGGPLWFTVTCRVEGAQVADAYERP